MLHEAVILDPNKAVQASRRNVNAFRSNHPELKTMLSKLPGKAVKATLHEALLQKLYKLSQGVIQTFRRSCLLSPCRNETNFLLDEAFPAS